MWIWAVFPCANWGRFNQHQCCFSVWTGQDGEIGLCSSPRTKSIKSALNGIFFHFKTNIKDFRNSNVSRVADLKGVFEIYTAKKQRRAWRNATSPSVQHTAHSLMAPYEDPPTSYSLLLFLLFLASIPSQLVRWLLFLAWPHVLASLLPLLASASWRTVILPLYPKGQLHLAPTLGVYIQRGPATSTSWFHFQ